MTRSTQTHTSNWNPDISIWLSVDPLSDKYPSLSPYNYCANNPIKYVDPDGRSIGIYIDMYGNVLGKDHKQDNQVYLVYSNDVSILNNNQGRSVDQSELNDPIVIGNYEQRQKLGELNSLGKEKQDKYEMGMIISTNNDNSNWGWLLFQGKETETSEGTKYGRVDFSDKPIDGLNVQENFLIISHVHNVSSDKPLPPTTGADKVPIGISGIVFDTNINRTYIYSSKTISRENVYMETHIYLKSFNFEGDNY